jgi:hypothetical protein
MGIAEIAVIATTAAISAANQIGGGALEEVGAQILKFLQSWFKDKLSIEQAKEQPEILQATIIAEASKDNEFKDALEKLVAKFQEIENNQREINQNASSGSANINVANNQGQVTGIDQRDQRSFR